MIPHCDDYIDDLSYPECLRNFLSCARAPASDPKSWNLPKLYASVVPTMERVKVTMASRLGDVGIVSAKSKAGSGYSSRVPLYTLTNFSEAQ